MGGFHPTIWMTRSIVTFAWWWCVRWTGRWLETDSTGSCTTLQRWIADVFTGIFWIENVWIRWDSVVSYGPSSFTMREPLEKKKNPNRNAKGTNESISESIDRRCTIDRDEWVVRILLSQSSSKDETPTTNWLKGCHPWLRELTMNDGRGAELERDTEGYHWIFSHIEL